MRLFPAIQAPLDRIVAHPARTLGRLRRLIYALALLAPCASANHHSFQIEQIYSNADGTDQFIVLHEMQGMPAQNWAGQTLTSTHAGMARTYTFATDLPSNLTAHKRVLVATTGFAALNLLAPDYVIPNQFVPTDGGSLDYAGVDQVTFGPLPTQGTNAIDRNGASVANLATNFVGAAAVVPAWPVTAAEFYNVGLDHYFISDLQPDLDALDSGRIAGWARTGASFRVHPNAASGGAGANPVCRFYIPPAHGNSHFFSASPAECAAIQQKAATDPNFSGYVNESPNVFYIALPDTTTGACPPATEPVYRLWNQRADSNHRYTADVSIKAQMLAKSYLAEGYGPDAVIMCAPTPGSASIQFVASAGSGNGALVDDGVSIANANFQGYATATNTVNVGPRVGAGEVAAFSANRAVALQAVTWTAMSGDQTVMVPLASEISTPITIWVVAGPYASTQQTALTWWQSAQQLYADERLGVSIAAVEIVDATANPRAASWGAFTCGVGNANVASLQTDVGARLARVNVYLVGLVDGSTSRGNACNVGSSFVAVAAGGAADLLAHELGHAFGLEHIDDLVADFDPTNVMYSASTLRAFLTEGQIFRAHLRSYSAINAVYAARAGLPVRDCDRDTPSAGCPAIRRRIWADGIYPPN